MATLSDSLQVYRDLADHYDRAGQVSMRDRFLLLAADAALVAGQPDEAERLRQRLLAVSRHHMLRPYSSYAEAARAADVQAYLANLKANYPPRQAQELLDSLRIEMQAAARPLAPTAPLLDLNASARAARIDEPRSIYPLQPEEPRAAPKPRAQPVPAPLEPSPALNPLPVAPAPTRRVAASEPAFEELERPSGGWFNVLLIALAVLGALALVAFVLGRPFLNQWVQ